MTLNSAAIGRRLAVSRKTAMAWTRAYEKAGLIHLLCSPGTRQKPLVLLSPCFTDKPTDFVEGLVLEAMRGIIPACRFRYWRTGRVRLVPLIADTGAERVGFCLSRTLVPHRRQWLPLLIALRRGVIDRAFLLHADTYAKVGERGVLVLPTSALLSDMRGWILDRRTPPEVRMEMARINRQRLARWSSPR